MAAVDEDIWPQASIYPKASADPKDRIGFSKYIMDGRVVFDDVIKFYYDQTNEMFGTDFEPPK
jgi:ribonuclease Z